jgi:hypothetical protein
MPRRIIYGISLWIFLGAFACTIASIALPNWISYTSPASGGGGDAPIRVTYGLHRRCSTVTGTCTKFPAGSDCRAGAGADGGDRTFCALWRSVGFAMNLSVVLELACVVAYVTVLVGGRATREAGWKVLGALLAVVGVAECVAMGIVVSGLSGWMDGNVGVDGYGLLTGVSLCCAGGSV